MLDSLNNTRFSSFASTPSRYAYPRQACVRRRAIESVSANPACPNPAAAERAVNEVWESCFSDTRPFDEVCFVNLYFGIISMRDTRG